MTTPLLRLLPIMLGLGACLDAPDTPETADLLDGLAVMPSYHDRASIRGLELAARPPAFASFEDAYQRAVAELAAIDDPDARLAAALRHADVATYVDGQLQPRIDLAEYRAIANRDRMFRSADRVHKVVDREYLVSADLGHAAALRAIESIDGLDPAVYRVARYQQAAQQLASCQSSYLVDYFLNQSGCRNDRRVWASARTFFLYHGQYSPDPFTHYDIYQPTVLLAVYGEKRAGTTCTWSEYSTTLRYRNVSFSVDAYRNDFIWPTTSRRVPVTVNVADHDTPDESLGVYAYVEPTSQLGLSDPLVGEAPGVYSFTGIHFEAASRGTNNNWAVIDCQ